MTGRSIRTALTGWFVGFTILLLGSLSAVSYFIVADTLHGTLDANLRSRCATITALCEWDDERSEIDFEAVHIPSGEAAGGDFDVWSGTTRRGVFAAGRAILAPVAWDAAVVADAGAALWFDLPPADGRRVCTLRTRFPGEEADDREPAQPAYEVVVRVAADLQPIDEQLRRIRWLTLALFAGTLVLVWGFGRFLSRRFVRPLEDLGRAADGVRGPTPTRMPIRGTGDEIDRLAVILDRSFTSLDEALARQTRFTADAAHELRNPIAIVRSAADVALRSERTPEEYRQFLGDVQATAARMGEIVAALLTLARLDATSAAGEFSDVDLAGVVRESIAVGFVGNPRLCLEAGPNALVKGDGGLLKVLVDNLLSNALRYSEDEPVDVRLVSTPDAVELHVRDRGPGIPHEIERRVFERFYRGPSQGSGTDADPSGAGLGLSIVADVVHLHGATCRIEAAHPGTEFIVRIPRAS